MKSKTEDKVVNEILQLYPSIIEAKCNYNLINFLFIKNFCDMNFIIHDINCDKISLAEISEVIKNNYDNIEGYYYYENCENLYNCYIYFKSKEHATIFKLTL